MRPLQKLGLLGKGCSAASPKSEIDHYLLTDQALQKNEGCYKKYLTDVKKGGSMKIVRLIIWIAVFFVAWTGFDYVNATFISKEGFVFAPGSNLIIPVACGVIVWFLLEKKNSNK